MSASTGFDAAKIKRDIKDLEDKKSMLLLGLQKDVDTLNAKVRDEFCRIGEQMYDLFEQGNAAVQGLADFGIVRTHKGDINAKNAKMAEVSARYDEEIGILQNLAPAEPPAPALAPAPVAPAAPAAAAVCVCGGAYIPGADKFCQNCGAKLPDPGAAPTGNMCKTCGAQYNPATDNVCAMCGTRLR